MIMTREIRKVVATTIQTSPNSPQWLRHQAGLTYEQVMQLPPMDASTEGQDASPSVEEKAVAVDYIEFLHEQIKLGARGPEWTELLKRRITVLEPYVNRRVITVMCRREPFCATIKICSETMEAIGLEVI